MNWRTPVIIAAAVTLGMAGPAHAQPDPGANDGPVLAWLVAGGGGVLLVTGGTLLAFHHQGLDCVTTTAGSEVCPRRRNTLAPAAALGAAGLVAAIGGLYFALRHPEGAASADSGRNQKLNLAISAQGIVLSGGF